MILDVPNRLAVDANGQKNAHYFGRIKQRKT